MVSMLMEYTLNLKEAKLKNFSANMDHGYIKFLKLCFTANIWIYFICIAIYISVFCRKV